MKVSCVRGSGISPVIAVLLMVALTLVIAGAAAIWFFGFANSPNEEGEGEIYVFDVKLDGGDDTITISIVNGDILNTSRMSVILDDTPVDITTIELNAGTEITFDAGMDLQAGEYYNVKITVGHALFFNDDIIASP